jgi:CDP-diacylglycerol---serine O-phosphatidyltransferase
VKWIFRQIPNFITSANLVCGLFAIILAFEHDYYFAGLCVGLAVFFDFFDGFAARLLGVSGEMGKQLDSLADVVSFGVAPGMIMMHFFMEINEMNALGYTTATVSTNWICYFPLLIPVFSAWRLAKFNIDPRQSDSFIGLPTPANAILFSSIALICKNQYGVFVNENIFLMNLNLLVPLIIVMCFLLVSELPLFSLKFKSFSWADNRLRFLFLFFSALLIVFLRVYAIPLIILFYISLSFVLWLVNRDANKY